MKKLLAILMALVLSLTGLLSAAMAEEVAVLGYEIGSGKLVERCCGSCWGEKQPKIEIMRQLCEHDHIAPENLLVVGDGRSEVFAGVEMGALVISRLDANALRAREIHREIGCNLIVRDYQNIRNIFEVR